MEKQLTIQQYADILKVAPDAIRMRIMRGTDKTLPGLKDRKKFGKAHLFIVDVKEAKKISSERFAVTKK